MSAAMRRNSPSVRPPRPTLEILCAEPGVLGEVVAPLFSLGVTLSSMSQSSISCEETSGWGSRACPGPAGVPRPGTTPGIGEGAGGMGEGIFANAGMAGPGVGRAESDISPGAGESAGDTCAGPEELAEWSVAASAKVAVLAAAFAFALDLDLARAPKVDLGETLAAAAGAEERRGVRGVLIVEGGAASVPVASAPSTAGL
mmetsp:Transcript_93796/g.261129  ORF Transcript_93796/g.261129 Transcript_93796/m.261129 type:complete len:201 (+) Transcript_93796:154-756(+)|eukprot:CAMPEP_0179073366 /NCGR_PEP_ID=MMETSP0796-20121207/32533_1 /TAXON_ID=73915 /ORGANISM="Pyrodinium bahamense, Strain pbaha01" /LENGTH=200 /DNA_ID=CAMNT_0020770555 /DNA_START=151 /DNA_END=753 /DNA_ORIENTATION=+